MAANQNVEKNKTISRYSIYIPDSVKKSLAKISLPWSLHLKQTIDRLEYEPFLGEKMKGEMKKNRKIKVWPHRIIYQIDQQRKLIKILEVERRGNISYD